MKLVFIIGTGRCGSTLLSEILAKHKDSSFISAFEEKHSGRMSKLGAWASEIYRKDELPLLKQFANEFRPTEAYALIREKVSPIYVQPSRDLVSKDITPWLEGRFRDFFQSKFALGRKPVLVHKYTGWSRLEFFEKIFPEAKFIHVVRDGRAVANSWLQKTWWSGYRGPDQWLWGPLSEEHMAIWKKHNYSFVALAGICWIKLIESYNRASEGMSADRYLEIKYEDFIRSPTLESKAILDFSGLEWSGDFERQLNKFHIGDSRARAYKHNLNSEQQDILEAVLESTLVNQGY
ncbi:MAG: sulfotransferase [Pseudomonadales bacterium]|nr:sulfotransferase [Pseudomonadales bacterium]